jgi:hypothetical protein
MRYMPRPLRHLIRLLFASLMPIISLAAFLLTLYTNSPTAVPRMIALVRIYAEQVLAWIQQLSPSMQILAFLVLAFLFVVLLATTLASIFPLIFIAVFILSLYIYNRGAFSQLVDFTRPYFEQVIPWIQQLSLTQQVALLLLTFLFLAMLYVAALSYLSERGSSIFWNIPIFLSAYLFVLTLELDGLVPSTPALVALFVFTVIVRISTSVTLRERGTIRRALTLGLAIAALTIASVTEGAEFRVSLLAILAIIMLYNYIFSRGGDSREGD